MPDVFVWQDFQYNLFEWFLLARFGLVWFLCVYDISTFVGYLMRKPFLENSSDTT